MTALGTNISRKVHLHEDLPIFRVHVFFLLGWIGGDFIEFGDFKSPTSRGPRQWPELPPQPSPFSNRLSPSSAQHEGGGLPAVPPPMSRRNSAEERRQRKLVTAQRALILAETDVSKAMDLIREAMPMEFMAHSSW